MSPTYVALLCSDCVTVSQEIFSVYFIFQVINSVLVHLSWAIGWSPQLAVLRKPLCAAHVNLASVLPPHYPRGHKGAHRINEDTGPSCALGVGKINPAEAFLKHEKIRALWKAILKIRDSPCCLSQHSRCQEPWQHHSAHEGCSFLTTGTQHWDTVLGSWTETARNKEEIREYQVQSHSEEDNLKSKILIASNLSLTLL